MVRNSVSMVDLRTNMANLNVDAPQPRPQPLQPRDNATENSQTLQNLRKRPSMQLFGDDAYTKQLMNRVATGLATPEEQAAFNTMVNNMQTSKPIPSSSAPRQPPGRLELEDDTWTWWLASNSSKLEDKLPLTAEREDTAFMDYQEQLKALEKQNKKRRAKGFDWNPPSDRRRQILAMQEMNVLGNGGPDKNWFHRHNPVLIKPQAELTAADRAQVDHLWKNYLCQQAAKRRQHSQGPLGGLDAREEVHRFPMATREEASKYTKPFCDFLTENPTVFHAVDSQKNQLRDLGWTELNERNKWEVQPGGRYFVERNGSSLIAFVVGQKYESGNGAAILAGHVDALTAKLKPISEVPNRAGYLQLGVAPYAGAPNNTWWDRDLGIGGRVLIKDGDKIVTKLVKLDWPIARIPTLAPHFGAAAQGPFNAETQMVPIVGLEDTDASATEVQTADPFSRPPLLGGEHGPVGSFVNTQPRALVKAIGDALGIGLSRYSSIVNWELELFDVQPATVGGLNKDFIYAGRIDDKLCSWSAMQALIHSADTDTEDSSIIKVVAWFDDEEIGSQLRQGAKSNFLPQALERAVGSLAKGKKKNYANLLGQTYANSFLVSSDVTHAVNPNFLNAYHPQHAPHLNVGLCVCADSNGHMTTDSVSTAILKRCADKVGAKLQVFQIRNDSRSGGTVGPMLSSALGIRAIDAGMPQLSMHSIRATTGALDPGLGVLAFVGFLSGFESVDKEFQQ